MGRNNPTEGNTYTGGLGILGVICTGLKLMHLMFSINKGIESWNIRQLWRKANLSFWKEIMLK